MTSRFNKKADRVVTVSQYTKNDVVENYGVSPEKITVACNGCGEGFQSLNEAEKEAVRSEYSNGHPYFFFVGAIHPRKNVHRLINAFDLFKKATGSPAKLMLAGRFAWKSGEVKEAYDKAVHKQDVKFLGYVSDVELPKLMGGALACTYVSLFEGFGIPILQAMHAEVPIITSNTSSMPEVAGDAGLKVNPFSTEEIAEAMQQIWQDAHLRNTLIEKGKSQRRNFTWQKAADTVFEALKETALL